MLVDALSRRLTKRSRPLIDPTQEPSFRRVAERVRTSRILVVGGAGSIGRSVVEALCALEPLALHVVDIDENGLADLVRDLRSGAGRVVDDFHTSVVDFGTAGFARLARSGKGFDVVLNLAAMKHVRSERDVYTLHRMLDTNARAVADLCALSIDGAIGRVFSVSSDKAVNPHSHMGASKRWMEKIVCAAGGTSARFANVAFSKGSLPSAMLQRLERGEPIAAPSDVSRYFITHEEAAHLCLIAAFDAADGEIVVPDLAPEEHAVSMVEVAEAILDARGLEPRLAADVQGAKNMAAKRMAGDKWWPCLFEPASTGGEKDMEELLYAEETPDRSRYRSVSVVRARVEDEARLQAAMKSFHAATEAPEWLRSAFVSALEHAVPELRHAGVEASLDERM